MKACLTLLLSWILATSVSTAQEFPTPLEKLALRDGDSIVFLGDSITHQCLYTQYVEDFFYTRYPHMRLKMHNAGVGGARAWDALQRLDKDVLDEQPKYVTILLGMNDGTYIPYDEETFQTYRRDMLRVVQRIHDSGATPILMTPTMFDARAARLNPRRQRTAESVALYNSVLAYYGAWCREVALENGFGFVDMWSPLNNITMDQRKQDANFTLIADAVHPDPPGQVVMATAMIEQLGLQRRVSTIRVSKSPQGEWTSRAVGGELTDLQETQSGISFTWHAKSLPWVLPEDARLGVQLTRLGHRLSGEQLEIHGLPAGRYTLAIDGETVGEFTSDQLGRHIELQDNEKTPQYRQALAVAMLNKTRNEQAVRPLRGEWSQYQRYARIQRDLEANPLNESLQEQLAQLQPRIDAMSDRVAELKAQAERLEDEIFSINPPRARQYVLSRVAEEK